MAKYNSNMQLVDWLDDLCVRFIINLPPEELLSVERMCFQIEEAQWFYEDFIRPLDPNNLPSMNLRKFSLAMFQHCPLSASFSVMHHTQAYEDFLAYKTRVPVRGAIMLNQEMTHAVLVKGWKKGAKWSFPRGKINKEEPDLDCAVREVYEETGFDLKEAGLVGQDRDMKKISVNMREQNMVLYVFRGVPMDTSFEPRTRKEISKIDWYKLTNLPTLKRKNQTQQGTGQDLVKENNFYMVAPFLLPLKSWIKQQSKLDRQRAKAGAPLPVNVAPVVTDTDEVDVDLGETTADEVQVPKVLRSDRQLENIVGQGHRASDTLPEVTGPQQTDVPFDAAAELKKMLNVGMGLPLQTAPVEAPESTQQHPPANPLLAMLQGNIKSNEDDNQSPLHSEPHPRTPFEQFMPPPVQPQSPHGQHHPRPLHLEQMPPPPSFAYHLPENLPFRPPQHPPIPSEGSNGFNMSMPRHPMILSQQQHVDFPNNAPGLQQAFSHQAPRPYQQTGDPQFAQLHQDSGTAIPSASRPPPPKLTAHALGLLNAFKMNEKPVTTQCRPHQTHNTSQVTPTMQPSPALHHSYESHVSPQALLNQPPYPPSPPTFQSPAPHANFQTAQPKPRSAHQDSLLSLFRVSSAPVATPSPQTSPEAPVELSALPTTPGYPSKSTASVTGHPKPDPTLKSGQLSPLGVHHKKPDLTSATVSGPVNAPDFATVKRKAHGGSRGPSPIEPMGVEQKTFVPQQILRRGDTLSTLGSSVGSHEQKGYGPIPKATSNANVLQELQQHPKDHRLPPSSSKNSVPPRTVAPNAHAQALLDVFKGTSSSQSVSASPLKPTSAPAAPHMLDRKEPLASDQKNALLSLFSQPSSVQAMNSSTAASSALSQKSPLPSTKSPRPPTPKDITSGVISPVSPLPADKGSQAGSPANIASRSRISSIGDTVPPGVLIPQTTIPTSHPDVGSNSKSGLIPRLETGYISLGPSKAQTENRKSPVDKTFLLGFLEDVARRG